MRRLGRVEVAVAALAAALVPGSPVAPQEARELPINDAHVHLVDFLQNGDFLENGELVASSPQATLPVGQRGKRIEALLWAMDRAGVQHAMVSGLAFLKKWSENDPIRPAYYLDSSSRVLPARDTDYTVALAIEDYRLSHGGEAGAQLGRLHPFVAGVDTTDLGAVDMIVKRMKEFPGLFQGIGELMSRHDDLTNLTIGTRPRANHPALFRIFDFAGQFDIPVSIHHNIAAISPNGEPKQPVYLPELLNTFNVFADTRFILCHGGISRRIVVEGLTDLLAAILEAHADHVYIDLSWVVFSDYVLSDLEGWASLIEKYPGNFMVGSDVVGRFGGYKQEIRRFEELFERLQPETAIKVAHDNFLSVMPEQGLTLPADYDYPEMRYVEKPSPVP